MRAFLVETKKDTKLQILDSRFPVAGMYAWIELLSNIYGVEGYYMRADDITLELFANSCKIRKEKMKKIISCCLDLGLFDKDQYERNAILTSNAIQRSFMKYYSRAKEVIMENSFLVSNFDKNAYKNLKVAYKNEENVCNSAPISFHTLHVIDDDYKAEEIIDLETFFQKLAIDIQRTVEAYGELRESEVWSVQQQLRYVLITISDQDIIHAINRCKDSTTLGKIWWLAIDLFMSDSTMKVGNKEGYLKKSIENLFKEGIHAKNV